ncbi:MAG: sulfatase [Roseibacillus sp.]
MKSLLLPPGALPSSLRFAVACCLLGGSLSAEKPNIILIFTDDQGYEDLGCFGSKSIKTPNLDRMAAEGLKLTSFYAQPVCGVSRAALMTGCYPIRIGEPGNLKRLHTVPHPKEVTMAEVLKSAGYATALIGKWHLTNKKASDPGGYDQTTMPNAQGFDYFYGTPLYNGFTVFVGDTKFRSSIFRNREVVVEKVESWDHITADYTREAIGFIEKNKEQPFFLYLAHNLPHIPVGASGKFKGKSRYGPYGDTIEEIDWSCGEILSALKRLQLDEKTLVIFTSDNGPWVETTRSMKPGGQKFIPRDHSGSAAPLRGWKMAAWDGGCRVPCVVRWPGKVPAGRVTDEILSTMDLFPTFAALAEAVLPESKLDGRDARAFLMGESETSPRDEYFYYTGCLLTAVRSGKWKLVLPRVANPPGTGWWGRMIEAVPETQLFDLSADPGETTNRADKHPEIVEKLMERIERGRRDLGDIDRTGSGARFFEEGPRKLQVPVRKRAGDAPVKAAYDGSKPLGNLRFTFESGTLEGWKVVQGQLGKAVSAEVSLPKWKEKPFNREGKFHLSTLNTGAGPSDKQTATLESPRFVLRGDRASFLASGGFDEATLYVALCDAMTGDLLRRAGGTHGPQMHRVTWDLTAWKGRTVFLRIVDRHVGAWGHLMFDDFSVDGEPVAATPRGN